MRVKPLVGNGHQSLPGHPFLKLSVTQDGIHVVVITVDFGVKGHAGSQGKPVAEGARAEIDSPCSAFFTVLQELKHGRVAFQGAVDLFVDLQDLAIVKPGPGQCCIQGGCRMSLAHDDPVTSLPEGIAGIVIQDVLQPAPAAVVDPSEIETGQDIR